MSRWDWSSFFPVELLCTVHRTEVIVLGADLEEIESLSQEKNGSNEGGSKST